jgi:hypothetical protein
MTVEEPESSHYFQEEQIVIDVSDFVMSENQSHPAIKSAETDFTQKLLQQGKSDLSIELSSIQNIRRESRDL